MPEESENLQLDKRLVKLETLVEVAVNEIKDQRKRTEDGFNAVYSKIDSLSTQLTTREEKYDAKYADKENVNKAGNELEKRIEKIEGTIRWGVRLVGATIILAILSQIIKPQ